MWFIYLEQLQLKIASVQCLRRCFLPLKTERASEDCR